MRSFRQRHRLFAISDVKLSHVDRLTLAAPVAWAFFKDSGDLRSAVLALVAVQGIHAKLVPVSLNEQVAAVRTVRALPRDIIDVADIDVF